LANTLIDYFKAPFMATFKVRKSRVVTVGETDLLGDVDESKEQQQDYDVWQAAIFKVGDDCRQDVLALQVIAMFKNIFSSIGLTVYLFPYRVTATAPGVSGYSGMLGCFCLSYLVRRYRRGSKRNLSR
jgi:phosphatidylinositol 4-kinase A